MVLSPLELEYVSVIICVPLFAYLWYRFFLWSIRCSGRLAKDAKPASAKNPELQDSDNSDSKSVMEGLIKTVNGVLDVAGAVSLVVMDIIIIKAALLNDGARWTFVVLMLLATVVSSLFWCKVTKVKKERIAYIAGLIMMFPMAMMGTNSLLRWVLPDVVTIAVGESGVRTQTSYEWCAGNGTRVTGSYIDNQTLDTLYRVVVAYALPEEDTRNVYCVTGEFPPDSLSKMKGRADYYMLPIPPWMTPSHNRWGRYRTKRVFVVNKLQLLRFVNDYDMSIFGLKPHLKVNSISEPRDRPVNPDKRELFEYRDILYNAK